MQTMIAAYHSSKGLQSAVRALRPRANTATVRRPGTREVMETAGVVSTAIGVVGAATTGKYRVTMGIPAAAMSRKSSFLGGHSKRSYAQPIPCR